MKPIGPTIKRYLEDNQIKQSDLAEQISMSPSQLNAMLSKPSMDAEKLEKICIAIGLSPMTFFEVGDDGRIVNYSDIKDAKGPVNIGNKNVTLGALANDVIVREKDKLIQEKDKRISDKDETIAVKERLIEQKDDMIRFLKQQLGLKPGTDTGQ